jgi:hypothetical protein
MQRDRERFDQRSVLEREGWRKLERGPRLRQDVLRVPAGLSWPVSDRVGTLFRLAAQAAGATPACRPGGEDRDAIANAETVDTATELDDLARELVTQHRARRGGEHAVARHLEIGGADPTPSHSDDHLPRRGSWVGALDDRERLADTGEHRRPHRDAALGRALVLRSSMNHAPAARW